MNLRFVFSLIVSLLSLLPAAAQDLTRNWIRERIFLDAEGKECVTSVQYFDGIGRETLLLTDGLSPGGDVAGALTGESFAGRTSAKWLPATGLTGFDFLTPERVKSLAVSSHEGDSVPFSLTRRDALGRVSSVRNAGGDLVGKAKYRFFVRERLGSVRSVADEDGNVLQQNLYYARGGAWVDVCTAPGVSVLQVLRKISRPQTRSRPLRLRRKAVRPGGCLLDFARSAVRKTLQHQSIRFLQQ